VIASIISHQKRLEYVAAQLMDEVFMTGASYMGHQQAGYPLVKAAARSIGHGLTVTYTEHLSDSLPGAPKVTGLVWIHETSCHDCCCILGRECQVNLDPKTRLEKIEKIHLYMLDRIPNV
jgi:hypothetical protein